MIKDIIFASYNGEYKIELTFEDGASGVVDFSKYLSKGGVFNKFRDIEFFKDFKINEDLGVLTWGDEIDIAPETLYAYTTNSKLPDWMDAQDANSTNMSPQPSS